MKKRVFGEGLVSNLYAYVANNPVVYVYPDGQYALIWTITAIIVLAAIIGTQFVQNSSTSTLATKLPTPLVLHNGLLEAAGLDGEIEGMNLTPIVRVIFQSYYFMLVLIILGISAFLSCLRRYRKGNPAYLYYSMFWCLVLVILLYQTIFGVPNPYTHKTLYIIESSIVAVLVIGAIICFYTGWRIERGNRKERRKEEKESPI